MSPFDKLTATRRACVQCGYTAAIRHFALDTLQLPLKMAGGNWVSSFPLLSVAPLSAPHLPLVFPPLYFLSPSSLRSRQTLTAPSPLHRPPPRALTRLHHARDPRRLPLSPVRALCHRPAARRRARITGRNDCRGRGWRGRRCARCGRGGDAAPAPTIEEEIQGEDGGQSRRRGEDSGNRYYSSHRRLLVAYRLCRLRVGKLDAPPLRWSDFMSLPVADFMSATGQRKQSLRLSRQCR